MSFRVHTVGPAQGHPHSHTVVFLHGRDSECDEFAEEFFESEASRPADGPRTLRDLFPTFKWVFPGASPLASERFGMPLSQWFDMWSVENPDERPEMQRAGLVDSTRFLLDVIDREAAFFPRERIYLAGISQGFAMAVATFFAGGRGLAGLVGLCSWALPPLSQHLQHDDKASDDALLRLKANFGSDSQVLSPADMKATPVLLGHAIDDDVVPVENGRRLRDALQGILGAEIEWHEYSSGGHWINEPEGVDDIVGFFTRTMNGESRR
ncbi:phospholipase carboxylesterase [Colletotrichum sojae]|uniref:Phospholipase carboxylesterase n=1 Tax=Colletotrichum sojae TaxID=2175907 RepID=A0A8H6JA58_9PEZI|nr:phospholipase carboxylesterase [Colletotrichum sojae]